VAAVYRAYLNLTLADPAVIALLTWGITDRYTWLNGEDSRKDGLPERPLPFDEKLQPKQAFFAELKAIQSAPVR
jgi:endo-1,4-beta-xylanase